MAKSVSDHILDDLVATGPEASHNSASEAFAGTLRKVRLARRDWASGALHGALRIRLRTSLRSPLYEPESKQ